MNKETFIYLEGEKVRVVKTSETTCILKSMPVNKKFIPGDTILHDPEGTSSVVLKRENQRIDLAYDMDCKDKDERRKVAFAKSVFLSRGYSVEETIPGRLTLCYPSGIPLDLVLATVKDCKLELDIV